MRGRLRAAGWVAVAGALGVASCIARSSEPLRRQTDDDAGAPDGLSLDSGAVPDAAPDALDIDPHAVLGVDPQHGPFGGGTRTLVRGNGFTSRARVWFGDREVPAADLLPIDPQRIQVVSPPGSGSVDVTVQNGDDESTRATLQKAFTYDRFYAEPSSGPTSGGTIITLKGDGTDWSEATRVEIDRNPCELVEVVSETELRCRTPAGTAGAKTLSVLPEDGDRIDVLDGFLYGNSDDGFRGGLSGQPLDGELTVVALNDLTGDVIPGVKVLAGLRPDEGIVEETDENGVALLQGELGERQTVTLLKECFQPITFVDVPVDHITAYLLPVLSPACGAGGEPPDSGGTPGIGSSIRGEVVWEPDGEGMRDGWTNVPPPVGDNEREVAYVFRLSSDPTDEFSLPSPSEAVTPESGGAVGYSFYDYTSPGNFTLYALAGIEDRSGPSPRFTAYALGLLRGVAVKPGETVDGVYIPIDVPLDHALTLELEPPQPGPRGPDRVVSTVAVQASSNGYILLPAGKQTARLPLDGALRFVGVPPLVGTLAETKYFITARAVTGPSEAVPLSAIGSFTATSSSGPYDLGGFVPVPVVTKPAKNEAWELDSLELTSPGGGQPVDLTVVEIEAGGGLHTWTIAAPGVREELSLPDLEALDAAAALPKGALTVQVSLARIQNFVYGSLRYRELAPRGWNAYARDVYFTSH